MVKKYTYKGIVWVNLESPTQKDIEEVAREYRIHDIVAEELAAPSIRSKVDSHDDYVYFIFHFPVREASPGDADRSEIDFVVGKHFIITTHYAPFSPLEELGEILETRGPLIGKNKILNAGHLFFFIARHLYETLFSPLEAMTLELEDIERGIFEGQEREMVIRLSTASQRLIDFKKAIRSHRELLRSLEETGPLLFGSDFGFGGCLRFLGENSDFQSYAITIPKIIYKTERSCRTCQGSGVIVGFKCMYCAGTGFEIKHDYTTAYAISSSLALLFSALSLYDLKTSSNLPQLMTLNTTAIISSSGFAISGEYSMEAVRASSLLNRLDMNQINEAMRLAWLEMNDGLVSSLDQWHFYLNVLIGRRVGLCFSNGAICIIPEPESLYVANIAGYNFYSYEVDTPMQQLVLLVGLARLHDILRLRMQDATS
jgi:hypothetical protein